MNDVKAKATLSAGPVESMKWAAEGFEVRKAWEVANKERRQAQQRLEYWRELATHDEEGRQKREAQITHWEGIRASREAECRELERRVKEVRW